MKSKFLIFILTLGILSACGSQPTEAPTATPTEVPPSATATEPPTSTPAPTETAIPPTDTAVPTATVEPTTNVESSEVSFASDISPIFQSRCQTCHGGDRGTEEGLDMNSYANLMAGSDNGPVIIAGDADNSLLVKMLVQGKMPKRGPNLTTDQIQLIADWINQGALDN